jgi:hypothetical protein
MQPPVHGAPDGYQRQEAGPPWEIWTRPPAPERPPPPEARPSPRPQARRRGRSLWYALLAVAVVIPLLTPLYNRVSPRLWGLPFFYWGQMAFVLLGASVTAIVQLATRGRRT